MKRTLIVMVLIAQAFGPGASGQEGIAPPPQPPPAPAAGEAQPCAAEAKALDDARKRRGELKQGPQTPEALKELQDLRKNKIPQAKGALKQCLDSIHQRKDVDRNKARLQTCNQAAEAMENDLSLPPQDRSPSMVEAFRQKCMSPFPLLRKWKGDAS